jgi:hypothetical protein
MDCAFFIFTDTQKLLVNRKRNRERATAIPASKDEGVIDQTMANA